MAYTFNVNQLPATGAIALYSLFAALIAAGWTKVKDSDGTTYSSSGSQVTGGGSGANGFGNSNAWVVLECPTHNGNIRSICFQRGTTSLVYRIKYSAAARFTGGAPSATQVPSATDEVVLTGTGTDGAPGFTTWFNADNGYRTHVAAGGATENYTFYLINAQTGSFPGNTGGAGIVFDTLQNFDVGDVDPTWIYMYGTGVFPFGTNWYASQKCTANNGTGAWYGSTGSTANFQFSDAMHDSAGGLPATGGGASQYGVTPFSAKDLVFPVCTGRPSNLTAPTGIKGWLTMARWASVFRANGDTLSVSTSKDYLWIQGSAIPWAGVTPLS